MDTTTTTVPQMYIVLWPILLSVLLFAIGVIGTLLKVLSNQNIKKQSEQDAFIKELRDSINELPEKYALKMDFTIAITQIQKEMKDISEKIVVLNTSVMKALNDLSVKLAKLPGGDDTHE